MGIRCGFGMFGLWRRSSRVTRRRYHSLAVERRPCTATAAQRQYVMRHERRQQHISAFVAERTPQSDDQFVESCQVAGWDRGCQIAIAVRQAVARSCGVAAHFIRASDGFSHELDLLWDEDSLDSTRFWIDLQERLNLDLPDRDAERIRPPFSGDRTVAQMVQNVCEVVGGPTAA